MNDLQKVQLNILKAFIQVCNKHHLTYYLVGGTCLGAVRHQGFIPWDDDIDVGMPRKDYDAFLKLQKDFDQYQYFIQDFHTDPKCIYNFAKLRDSNTTYIESYYKNYQIHHGVWIDVFPLDGMSLVDAPAQKFKRRVRYTWHQVFLSYPFGMRRKFSKQTFFKDLFINLFFAWPFWFLNIGQYRNKRVDKKVKKINYDEAYLVGNYFGNNASREAMPKEIFLQGSKGIFEGIEVNLPKDYDKYLTLLFHDYMKLPPLDQQIGHHANAGYSLTQGYQEFVKQHKL